MLIERRARIIGTAFIGLIKAYGQWEFYEDERFVFLEGLSVA
jgi:primase-polymerase (primpol)-like protein